MKFHNSSWKKSREAAHEACRNSLESVVGLIKFVKNTTESIYYLIDGIDRVIESLDSQSRGTVGNFFKRNTLKSLLAASMIYYGGDKAYDYYKKTHPLVEVSDDYFNIDYDKSTDIISGIDISEYNEFDLDKFLKTNKLRATDEFEDTRPFEFIILRASKGHEKDEKFTEFWNALQTYNDKASDDSDLLLGAYHYYRPDERSVDQFKAFSDAVGKLPKGSIVPVLDIEKKATTQSMDRLRVGLKNRLRLAEEQYGVKPMIYTGQSFYNDHIYIDKELRKYPVWIAHYNKDERSKLNTYIMHQLTDQGNVPGANTSQGYCDINNALRDNLSQVIVE